MLHTERAYGAAFLNLIFSWFFSLIDPDLYGQSWNDWNEEKEKLQAKDTGEWLESNGYSLGASSWGEIWAKYDMKSGSGGGGVRYKH